MNAGRVKGSKTKPVKGDEKGPAAKQGLGGLGSGGKLGPGGMFPNYGMPPELAGASSGPGAKLDVKKTPKPGLKGAKLNKTSPVGQRLGKLAPTGAGKVDKSGKLVSIPNATKPHSLPKKKSPLPDIHSEGHEESEHDSVRVVQGSLYKLPTSAGNQVKLFISSTFSDMKAERNTLWRLAFGEIREYASYKALEFQVVDMRWGVGDEASSGNLGTSICLSEVERCKKYGAGPNFFALLGQRYGGVASHQTIAVDQFDAFLKAAREGKLNNKSLLTEWYRKDDNAIPPMYCLQSTLKERADQWEADRYNLDSVLVEAAKEAVKKRYTGQHALDNLLKSVTCIEIESGLNQEDVLNHVFAYERVLTDVDLSENIASKFVDVATQEDAVILDKEASDHLNRYVLKPMKAALGPTNHTKKTIPWHSGGLDPFNQSHEDYNSYLDGLRSWFLKHAKSLINKCAENRPSVVEVPFMIGWDSIVGSKAISHVCTEECMMQCSLNNVTNMLKTYKDLEKSTFSRHISCKDYAEVLHHSQVCLERSQLLIGRETELVTIKEYVKQLGTKKAPLCVFSDSGTGKTSFSALIGSKCRSWLRVDPVVVIRFLGTSLLSSLISDVLQSMYVQVCVAYGLTPSQTSSYPTLVQLWMNLLETVSHRYGLVKPLIIIIDGVDHLNPIYSPQHFHWLPTKCPSCVRIMISFVGSLSPCATQPISAQGSATTSKKDSEMFATGLDLVKGAQNQFGGENGDEFLSLELKTLDLSGESGRQLTKMYCEHHNRTLNTEQRLALSKAMSSGCEVFLGNLILHEAMHWPSYKPVSSLKLSATTTEAVGVFFDCLELLHGPILVSEALGLLTCSCSGISDVEMEDALSNCDAVLINTYSHHAPPLDGAIHLPTHLWSSLRNSLSHYLIEKGAGGKIVVTWYHRQVRQLAEERYVQPKTAAYFHEKLAEIYLAENGIRRTITLSDLKTPITMEDADRQVSNQPVDGSNSRLISCLPYHRSQYGDCKLADKVTYFNLRFLIAALTSNEIHRTVFQLAMLIETTSDVEVQYLFLFIRLQNQYQLDFSDKVRVSLQILGSFLDEPTLLNLQSLRSDAVEVIKAADVPMAIPHTPCLPTGAGILKWYTTQYPRFGAIDEFGAHLIITNSTDMCIINLFSFKTDISEGKEQILSVKVNEGSIYVLTDVSVKIHSLEGDSVVRFLTDKSKKKRKTLCFGLYPTGTKVTVGGDEGVEVFSRNEKDNKVSYKPTAILTLGGILSTENIVCCPDGKSTISSHTIASKTRKVAGVVLWNTEQSKPENKMSLPSPVQKGFLERMEDGMVVCGCVNKEVYRVNIEEATILSKLEDTSSMLKWVLTPHQLAILCKGFIRFWEGKKWTSKPAVAVSGSTTCFDIRDDVIAVGTQDGCTSAFTVKQGFREPEKMTGLPLTSVHITSHGFALLTSEKRLRSADEVNDSSDNVLMAVEAVDADAAMLVDMLALQTLVKRRLLEFSPRSPLCLGDSQCFTFKPTSTAAKEIGGSGKDDWNGLYAFGRKDEITVVAVDHGIGSETSTASHSSATGGGVKAMLKVANCESMGFSSWGLVCLTSAKELSVWNTETWKKSSSLPGISHVDVMDNGSVVACKKVKDKDAMKLHEVTEKIELKPVGELAMSSVLNVMLSSLSCYLVYGRQDGNWVLSILKEGDEKRLLTCSTPISFAVSSDSFVYASESELVWNIPGQAKQSTPITKSVECLSWGGEHLAVVDKSNLTVFTAGKTESVAVIKIKKHTCASITYTGVESRWLLTVDVAAYIVQFSEGNILLSPPTVTSVKQPQVFVHGKAANVYGHHLNKCRVVQLEISG